VGASSRDIRLEATLFVESTVSLSWEIHRNTLIGDLLADERTAPFVKELLQKHSPFGQAAQSQNEEVAAMFQAFLKYMPLRNIVRFNPDGSDLDKLIAELNRRVSAAS